LNADLLSGVRFDHSNRFDHVPPVARLRVASVARLRVEPNIDEIEPYVANSLRRVNALLAINNLMNNERK
jgi:hypothetical protein